MEKNNSIGRGYTMENMSIPLFYSGDKDCSFETYDYYITLHKDYFFEKESNCFCIPVSMYCTEVTGDVTQDFLFQDSVNDLRASLCFDHKQSCNAILYISKDEWRYNSHSKNVVINSEGTICGQSYSGEINFKVTKLQLLEEKINISRASECYKTLEFKYLWEKWRNNSYVLDVDIFDLIKSQIRKMNNVYEDEFGHRRYFLWSENGYRIEQRNTQPKISLEGLIQCTSPFITDVLKEEPELVCSVIISYAEANLDLSNDIRTIEDRWSIEKYTDRTRFLIHGLDDSLDYQDIHDIKYLEFRISDEGLVIVLLDNWDDIKIRECPFRNFECTPF